MSVTIEQVERWMRDDEGEHLEFKAARQTFNRDELIRYCAALANEGGGKLIFGVSDRKPRRVVGTSYSVLDQAKSDTLNKLRLRVDIDEVAHPDGRVLVLHIPSRPLGMALAVDGAYLMRSGESLVPMSWDMLSRIQSEGTLDFSARPCPEATLKDLSPEAIEILRQKWFVQSKNASLLAAPVPQLLADCGLVSEETVSYAGLILLGSKAALVRFLPNAEVIFEYRNSEASRPYQQRIAWREGLFLMLDALWETINLRNEAQQIRAGLYARDLLTFNENVVREAILNAVCHRDYQHPGSIFVRQYPRSLEIVSPGGFPAGVTMENILTKQLPRNRRIAETVEKCDMVERGGQGVNLMFEECIKESKPVPDYAGTDAHEVRLRLNGTVQNPAFVRFLAQLGEERMRTFVTEDYLVLDAIYREQPVPEALRPRLLHLKDSGAVEQAGRGSFRLSRGYYQLTGQRGAYTRKKGLDHETNKALLLQHIRDNNTEGSPLSDLMQVLPNLSRRQVQWLLQEVREEERAHSRGRTIAARWYLGGKIAHEN